MVFGCSKHLYKLKKEKNEPHNKINQLLESQDIVTKDNNELSD